MVGGAGVRGWFMVEGAGLACMPRDIVWPREGKALQVRGQASPPGLGLGLGLGLELGLV